MLADPNSSKPAPSCNFQCLSLIVHDVILKYAVVQCGMECDGMCILKPTGFAQLQTSFVSVFRLIRPRLQLCTRILSINRSISPCLRDPVELSGRSLLARHNTGADHHIAAQNRPATAHPSIKPPHIDRKDSLAKNLALPRRLEGQHV